MTNGATGYDPTTAAYPCFTDASAAFGDGRSSSREFLETCLSSLEAREPAVRAFTALRIDDARREADAATSRWRAGAPLSPVDGMPFAVKDCFDVEGLPTRVNSALFDAALNAQFDSAHVFALRRGGAILIGKTVTTELTMAEPGPTRNPWDLTRTPGGSSSGSAAAVAAGMVPIASGSQVRGSAIRPASICGLPALKPTFGALNKQGGFDPSPSLNHLAFLGGNLSDIWASACQVSAVVGGDPGHAAFPIGAMPSPKRPLRLGRQQTYGWPLTDDESKGAFERLLSDLALAGVDIADTDASPELAEYERLTTAVPEFFFDLMLWEARWPLAGAWEKRPEAFSPTMYRHLSNAANLDPAKYEHALRRRDNLRNLHRGLRGKVDAFIAPAHIGPGQLGNPALGTPWYNDASSAIGAPSLNLPLLSVGGLPLGVQIVGFENEDRDLFAIARWMMERFVGQGGDRS
jgi:Asp-tRNA(Asn)/Glu-tRNA(Gln) amidotransferase A subunit family amidase